MGHSTPLINNLEIDNIFKDKTKEEGVGVTDLINRIVLILKRDLEQFQTSIRDTGLLNQEDLGNKG